MAVYAGEHSSINLLNNTRNDSSCLLFNFYKAGGSHENYVIQSRRGYWSGSGTPAFSQGLYVGGPGVSIGVGSESYGHRYRSYDDDFDRPHVRRWSRSLYGAYAYSGGCSDITVRRQRWDGTMVVKRTHRCD
jgi:hypothetical protein